MSDYLRTDRGVIHLDYETISVVEAKINLTEIDPTTLSDFEKGNAFRVPNSDKYYNLEVLSLSGELIATGYNTSHNIWSAVRSGKISNGQHIAIETETCAIVLPDKPKDDNWTIVFSEGLCIMYERIKFYEKNRLMIHSVDNLIKAGDTNYIRNYPSTSM